MIYIAELELRNELAEQLGDKIDICIDNYSEGYKYLQEDLYDDFFIDFMKHYFNVEDEDFYVDVKRDPSYDQEMDLDEFSIAVQEDHKEMLIIPNIDIAVYYRKSRGGFRRV